jgi:hypothetical protein
LRRNASATHEKARLRYESAAGGPVCCCCAVELKLELSGYRTLPQAAAMEWLWWGCAGWKRFSMISLPQR